MLNRTQWERSSSCPTPNARPTLEAALTPAPSVTILVTGGAGFIGSHTCLLLLEARLQVVEGDIRNPADLDRAFTAGGEVSGVIHLPAVGFARATPVC